jgi:serine/threonine-protein kinase
LLTGRSVFEAETPMQMVLKHVNEQPEPPSRYTEIAVPAAMDGLVLACLEKAPDKRPQTAAEVIRRLESVRCVGAEWTAERAEEWWKTNLPDLLALDPEQPGTEAVESDPDRAAHVAPQID